MLFIYFLITFLLEISCTKIHNKKSGNQIQTKEYKNSRKIIAEKNRVVKKKEIKSTSNTNVQKSSEISRQIISLKSLLLGVRRWNAHSYEEMSWFLKFLNRSCEPYAHLYSIGSTVQNRDIWVLALSDNPSQHEPAEPEVKIIGNIHGNEGIGREIILHMIDHICSHIETDFEIQSLIFSTRIHFLPSMNPDGFEMFRTHSNNSRFAGRLNANGIDLNRNFPDQFFPSFHDPEPEVQAVMKWLDEIPFVLSASLHDGAFVVTYPYDDSPSGQTKYSATPDDDIFRFLSRLYAETHPEMHLSNMGNCSRYSQHKKFIGGITNGAEWSSLTNTMQDYNYVRTNCFEITVEMSCNNYLNETNIPSLFNQHYPSLMAFIRQASRGIRGFVRDSDNNPLESVHISISDRKHDIITSKYGDYWRLVLPGTYEVSARLRGYEPSTRVVTVENSAATWVNFTLTKTMADPSIVTLGHVGSLQKYLNLMSFESDGRDSDEIDSKAENAADIVENNQEDVLYENRDNPIETEQKAQDQNNDIIRNKYILPNKQNPTEQLDELEQKNSFKTNDILECSIPGRTQFLIGKLKWSGIIPDLMNHTSSKLNPIVFGIELVDADNLATDGTFLGKRYFTTKPKHAYFVPNNLCEHYKNN